MTMPPNRIAAARRLETTPMDSAERVPWVAYGLSAGALGASCVALFFLLVDAVMGRPFWTPHALGAVLFRGEVPSVYAAPEPLLVIAYTAVHVAVFVGFATPAAFFVLARMPSTRGRGGAVLVALALFVAFEVVFLSLAQLFAPALTGMLTAGRVATANALAAAAMTGLLYAGAHRRRPRRRVPAGRTPASNGS
jgi:hypothetical protein